jgi:hypothetical protein
VVTTIENNIGTTYFGKPSSNIFSIGPNLNLDDTPYFYINSSGNVGIGTTSPDAKLDVHGDVEISGTTSGATLLNIIGSSGQLFSVTDNLIGDIFSVNDISGVPILTVNSNDRVIVDGVLEINSFIFNSLTSGTHTVAEFDETLGSAAYFDYYVTDGSGRIRCGTVMAVWNGTSTEFTETSTKDLGGSTAAVTFTVGLSGGNVQLRAAISGDTWTIKTGIRII